MANSSGVVGVLRALLTADTAQFDTAMRKAATTTKTTQKVFDEFGKEVQQLTPQAERMVKALSGQGAILRAQNLAAAIEKLGGVTKLTAAEQARANATFTLAAEKLKVMGLSSSETAQKFGAMAAATKQVGASTSILSSSFATLTASFTVANLITRATSALTGFVSEAIRGAGELVDLSGKTGLSTETLQRMAFVADQTGATLDDFTTSAFQLGIRVSEGSRATRDAFDELKKASQSLTLSFEQFQKLTLDEQFAQTAQALGEVEDQQKRNTLGVQLMGRTYAQVAAAIADNYDDMAKGAKLSTDAQIRAIDDAADAWGAFLKSTTTSVQANLANLLLFGMAIKQAISEMGIFSSTAAIVGRAQDILALGILKTRNADITLTPQATAAEESYRAQLARVRAEVAALTADQRAEIDAGLALGRNAADLEKQFGLTEGALALLQSTMKDSKKEAKDLAAEFAKLGALQAQAFGLDKVKAATDMVDAIGGLSGVVLMDAAAQKQLNTLLNEAIDAAQRNGQIVPLEWFRIEEATRSAFGTLQDYLKLVDKLPEKMQEIPTPTFIPFTGVSASELETERLRDLLAANPPGSGIWKETGAKIGNTVGTEIKDKLKNAFEDIPHFLVSSVLHSGNFLNGLKALGISMADAIAEPLLRELAHKLATAHLLRWIGIGSTASTAAGTAPAWLAWLPGIGGATPPDANKSPQPQPPTGPGVVPIPPTPPGGGGHVPTPPPISNVHTGGMIAGAPINARGEILIKALPGEAVLTASAARALGGKRAIDALNAGTVPTAHGGWFFGRDEETKVNPLRDQFFAQFQRLFGGKQTVALATAFRRAHVMARAADNATKSILRAEKLAPFRRAEARALSLLQVGGLTGFQSFNLGGFVPPGVIQPAILHGPEWVIPEPKMPALTQPSVPNVNIAVHTHISAIDTQGVREFVESPSFLSPLGNAIERNTGFLATRIQRSRTK